MRPTVVQVGPLAAPSANNIAHSQTPGGAGNLTLNGGLVAAGVAVLDTPRRVLFTPAGAESGNGTIWTVYGTDWNSNSVSETVAGVDNPATAYTKYDYVTVTQIAVNKGQAGAVTVGTNGIASSRPIFLDPWALAQTIVQVNVSGTISYTVRQTLDDPNSPTNPVVYQSVSWIDCPVAALVTGTTNIQGTLTVAPKMIQLLVNSNTNPATAKMTVIQSGSAAQ